MPKQLAVLGSTGSIGTQTLDVVSRHPDRFGIEILTAGDNVRLLIEQSRKFKPDVAVIGNEALLPELKKALADLPVKTYGGAKAIEEVVTYRSVDMVVAAIVGFSGLRPVVEAIRAGKDVALANKETLVVAGDLIRRLNLDSKSRIIPVDSEHSAIFQCLVGEFANPIKKITLTASGGPFRNHSAEQLTKVTRDEALKHPNWSMGDKITVDSASMMNKGLEVIEARWLFDIEPSKIDVVIHPQSIIHSMVHFADGSTKAQMGLPDMRVPIVYALSYPDRIETNLPSYDPISNGDLTFERVDVIRFPNLELAYNAINEGGCKPCILNGANEVVVRAFLDNKVAFTEMPGIIEKVMLSVGGPESPGLGDLENADDEARRKAFELIKK